MGGDAKRKIRTLHPPGAIAASITDARSGLEAVERVVVIAYMSGIDPTGRSCGDWVAMPLKLPMFVALTGLLGACTGAPPPQLLLMTPLAETRTHGYAEKTLSGGRIEVSYLGPSRRVPVARAERAGHLEGARLEAEDLALWRAAQIAIARKAPAFAVLDRRIDVEIEVRRSDSVYPFGGYGYYRYRARGHYPFSPYPFYGFGFRDAYAQARARLTVGFVKKSRPGARDALAVAAQMRQKYPNAKQMRAK